MRAMLIKLFCKSSQICHSFNDVYMLTFAFSFDRIALPPQKVTNLTKCIKLPFLEIGQQVVQDPDP